MSNRILVAYFSASGTTARAAKAIAQAHKGSIQVQCRDGMVIFFVKLPLQKQMSVE